MTMLATTKHRITLTQGERMMLKVMVSTGKVATRKITDDRELLLAGVHISADKSIQGEFVNRTISTEFKKL